MTNLKYSSLKCTLTWLNNAVYAELKKVLKFSEVSVTIKNDRLGVVVDDYKPNRCEVR